MSTLLLAVIALVVFVVVAVVVLLLARGRPSVSPPPAYVPPQPQVPVYPEDEPVGPGVELPDAYPAPRQWPQASGPTGDVKPQPGSPGWGPHQDWEKKD